MNQREALTIVKECGEVLMAVERLLVRCDIALRSGHTKMPPAEIIPLHPSPEVQEPGQNQD